MRSLLIMAAVVGAATLLSGCREKKHEPVPGPQSVLTQRNAADRGARAGSSSDQNARQTSPSGDPLLRL